jgi:hypothetical protein
MARIWNTPVFILATVYFVVDGVFSHEFPDRRIPRSRRERKAGARVATR